MQEGELASLFNKKCGNLQFLDPFCEDITAISFDKKLETFLTSVLMGDYFELTPQADKALLCYNDALDIALAIAGKAQSADAFRNVGIAHHKIAPTKSCCRKQSLYGKSSHHSFRAISAS